VLDSPADAEEIYLDRGGEIDHYRPVCQGDIFLDVAIPGLDPGHGVMVIAHPCVMRAGPRLRPKVTVIPIVAYDRLPLENWSTSHLRVFPLPALDPSQPDRAYAARFDEFGTVPTDALNLDRRVAMLSQRGVLLLQQRFIHSVSRVEIPLSILLEASAAVFEELELQENWNLTFVAPQVDSGEEASELLAIEAEAFDQVMRSGPEDATLRERLQVPQARAEVRRAVNQTIRERTVREEGS
jgi:hypothetical protein